MYLLVSEQQTVVTNVSLQNEGQGYTTAIEGDISKAYDKVNNDILLEILKERITDQKFINLMRNRLTLFDTKTEKYEQTFLGIPQGGIDSPSEDFGKTFLRGRSALFFYCLM
jgi:hypothetical protein